MTSAISTSSIDESYPIAGQDNNSQGFRDNFNAIKAALNVAKSEITTLQTNTAKLNAPNAFNGVLIEDAEFNKFYGSVRQNGTISVSNDIDLENGPLQVVSVAGNISLRFINWPDSDLFGKITLHLKNTSGSSKEVTFDSQGLTDLKYVSSEFTATGSLAKVAIANNSEVVVEAWTYDNGITVYLKNLGIFA